MEIKNIDWKIIVAAMICITILETVALSKGINGVILTAVIGTLAALAGLSLPQFPLKKKEER